MNELQEMARVASRAALSVDHTQELNRSRSRIHRRDPRPQLVELGLDTVPRLPIEETAALPGKILDVDRG